MAAPQIGEAGRETDHVDAVLGTRMQVDHLLRCQPLRLCQLVQILTNLAAIDTGYDPQPGRGCMGHLVRLHRGQNRLKLRAADLFGIIAQQQ